MPTRFINLPKPLSKSIYQESIAKAVKYLASLQGLTAIYQLGGINHPGISDIDLLLVIDDSRRIDFDPSRELSKISRYLFTHAPSAISRSQFKESAKYAVWYQPRLLWGSSLKFEGSMLSPPEREAVRRQTALEFLIENYIDLTVQLKYAVVKLRSTLQHIKAIRLDLDLLGITSGPLHEMVHFLLHRLDRWFESPMSGNSLWTWLVSFHNELEKLLDQELQSSPLYIPPGTSLKLSRNISLEKTRLLGYRFAGLSLSARFLSIHKKLFNANMRLNSFVFQLPQTDIPKVAVLEARYKFYKQIRAHAAQFFPHFTPFVTGFSDKILSASCSKLINSRC
jgi:hypothetical protein